MFSRLLRPRNAAAAAALSIAAIAAPTLLSAGSPNEQFIPLANFRVGAYASSGIPIWNGIIDTFRYINEVQGGINGVKLFSTPPTPRRRASRRAIAPSPARA